MSNAPEPIDVVVGEDGQVRLPPGFNVHPGEHLKLVRYEADESPKRRKSVRGIGVGKVDPESVLSWDDFEKAHESNVAASNERYGDS